MNKVNQLENSIIFMQFYILTVVNMQLLTVCLAWPLLSPAEFPYYLIRYGAGASVSDSCNFQFHEFLIVFLSVTNHVPYRHF